MTQRIRYLRDGDRSKPLFVLAAALFYAMLVAVPRQLMESDGGLGTWTRRFACFVVGSLTGIGLLASLGS